ncbi:hypothetical protein GPJ56_007449 [Histomonas meleagridis]|uniref:uncharacterized protein n=1 Tax=Histomonas meleagridis TaxID=135588 RepID=UPI003559FBA8|nr:hypothetical protein GPJ56_007449 [Histomonas meleagridis]KAH0804295.1 hypothetical protein GO595_003125 [Histomonas meleagridis]
MLAPEEQIVIGSFESASIGGSESDSIFYQMDKGTSGYTDMLTLGCFIHCLFTGNSPLDYNTKTFKVDSEIPDEVYDLLTNLLATDVEQRKRFSPKEHPFLSYAVEISIAKNFFSIDHVFVDWNDGFKAGFYNSEMTFKDGISFVSDSTVITFNDKELCFTSEDQILCLKEGELQLGCEYATYCLRDNLVLGNTSQDGSIQFTSESFYYTLGKQRVKIASDGVTTFYSNKPVIDDDKLLTDSAVKLKVLPNGITSTINRTDVTISKNGVKLILGSSEIILQPRGESLYVIFGTCSVYLSANEFNVHIGNYQISVNKEGVLNIISDKTIFVVNNKEVSVTNNGQPFNLNNFGVKVPNINIKLPKAKIPVPPKMFDSPNPSPASQRKFSIADYLFEGEEVILESNILKKAIFASDKMIAILTSYKRIIVLKQEYKGFKSEFKLPNSFGTKVSKTKLEIDTVKKKKIYNFLDEETAKQWAEKVSQFSQKKK